MNPTLVCPVCRQSFVVSAAAQGGTTHCPHCAAHIAVPSGVTPDAAGAIQIDTRRVSRTAIAQNKDWLGSLVLAVLVLLTLALLPVVYFVVGNALQR